MPYTEVLKLFYEGRQKLCKQKATTKRKVRQQQASMKSMN